MKPKEKQELKQEIAELSKNVEKLSVMLKIVEEREKILSEGFERLKEKEEVSRNKVNNEIEELKMLIVKTNEANKTISKIILFIFGGIPTLISFCNFYMAYTGK